MTPPVLLKSIRDFGNIPTRASLYDIPSLLYNKVHHRDLTIWCTQSHQSQSEVASGYQGGTYHCISLTRCLPFEYDSLAYH